MRVRILVSLAAVAALSIPAVAQLRSAADIGRVKVAAQSAQIIRGGKPIPAQVGMGVLKGDTLVTGKTGRIGITFNDNSRVAAGPNSRVEVADFAFNDTTYKGQFLTNVRKGSVAIVSGQIAKSNPNAMRVKTPTALLGVRGTRFVVEVN